MQEIKNVDIPIRQIVVGLKRDYFNYLQSLIDQYGSIFSFPFKPHKAIVITEPSIINHILITHKDNYSKGSDISGTSFNYLKAAVGESIFLTDNKKLWEKHRKIIMPNLQRSHYATYAEKAVHNCREMLNTWEDANANSQPINVPHMVSKLALHNLLHTLLQDGDLDADTLLNIVEQVKFVDKAATSFKNLIQSFNKIVFDYVKTRIQNPNDKHDMLSGLIAAYQNEMSNEQTILTICNEIKGILIAGHETVAASLTWTCYLLSKAPEIQMQIKEEYDSVFGERAPTYAELEQIPFTVATYKEALRLYPPIYSISRLALKDDVVNDIRIPKNGYIMIPVFHLHRLKKYWTEPETFQPERFLEDDMTHQMQAYLPFGAGERACIGREFAMMEATITIAMMISRYQISMEEDRMLTLEPINSLWPKEDLEIKIKPR